MSNGMPEVKYRCSRCQFPYAYMIPGGKCPCGGNLVEINQFLKNADDIWDQPAFDSFPCVIAHEYKRLYDLSKSNNIYGVFLQLRDVIETTVKFIILLSVAWGKNQEIKGREEAYEKYLATPNLSLGAWNALATDYLIPFYENRTNTKDALPLSLWEILSDIATWTVDNGLIKWRNEKLGHGAIGFDDDPAFQQELYNKIKTVGEFYHKHHVSFSSIQLMSDEKLLLGYRNARDLESEKGVCSVSIEGVPFSTEPLIIHEEHGIYFFDEVKKKKRLRMLNYQTGYDKELQNNDYAVDLIRMSQDQTDLLEASPESEFMTRAENDFLANLVKSDRFVEPAYLTKWLREDVLGKTKGVFLVEMERGCGKSVYTERLNRRFYGPLELSNDLDVRTYHLGRTQTGGPREFTQGIMEEWNSGFVNGQEKDDTKVAGADLKRYAVLEEDRDNPENNALLLADYLNKLRRFSSTCYARGRKKRIMLVLDGLDEINECNDMIWSFLPSEDLLENGVYILLTTRKAEKAELPQSYWDHLESLHLPESNRQPFFADSSENKAFLEKYIKDQGIGRLDAEKIDKLMELADYRILYLTLLCSQYKKIGAVDFSQEKRDAIIGTYLRMIEGQYSEVQKILFRRVLCTLSCVGCFEPLTLKEIAEINNLSTVSFALLDVMTDLLPLMRVDRGLDTETGLVSSDNRFSLRNEDVLRLVNEYIEIDRDLYVNSKVSHFRAVYDSDDYIDSFTLGGLVILSHYTSFAKQSGEWIKLDICDLTLCCACANQVRERFEGKDEILDQRELNLLRQIYLIHRELSEEDMAASAEYVWRFCEQLSEKLRDMDCIDEERNILEHLEVLLDYIEQDEGTVASLYDRLGDCYKALGTARAEECYQKALELYGHYLDNEACIFLCAGIKLKVARLYADCLRYKEAISYYQQAIELFKKCCIPDISIEESIVEAQISMADVFCRLGQGDQAEKTLRESRIFYIDRAQNNNIDALREWANVDCELADVLRRKRDLDQAYELDKEALSLLERVSLVSTVNTELLLAKIYNNKGIICKEMGKYNEAYDDYMEALKIYKKYEKKSFGVYAEDVAMTSMNIGNLLYRHIKTRTDEALDYYNESHKIYSLFYALNPQLYAKRYADITLMLAMYLHKAQGELIWPCNTYQKLIHLYEKLYGNNPAEFLQTYLTALFNQGTVVQLMTSWDNSAALDYFQRYYCVMEGTKGTLLKPEIIRDRAYKIFASEAANYLICPEEKMVELYGWSDESRDQVLKIRNDPNSPYRINQDIIDKAEKELLNLSGFNMSDAKKKINHVKVYYGQILSSDDCYKIVNGERHPACAEAMGLRTKGLYAEACELIRDCLITSGKLTTGTAEEIFLQLMISGDLSDALEFLGYMNNKAETGVINIDEYMLRMNVMGFIIRVGIEEYEGISIISYLSALSCDKDYQLKEEDLDIELRTGQQLPFIQAAIEGAPEEAKEAIRETKELIRHYEQGELINERSDLEEIRTTFRETFERVRDKVVSEIEVPTDLFYQAQNLKRNGRYRESNRLYCDIILEQGYLSTVCAVAWYKTLACSGDIEDALYLAHHVINSDVSDKHVANLAMHFNRLIFCIEGVYNHNPIEYLRKISGNPSGYALEEKDLNVECRTGRFNEMIKNCPKVLYREIVRMLP